MGPAGVLLAQGAVRGTWGLKLLSNDLTPGSRVLIYRNIRERAQRIAPFFRYDADPYMISARGAHGLAPGCLHGLRPVPVLGADAWAGQLATRAVKVTVDAYDGTVRFYVADAADP